MSEVTGTLSDEERIATVLDGLDSVSEEDGGGDTVTLSTGVVLMVKPVPKRLIQKVNSRFKKPKVPTQYIKDVDREVENPTHPQYKEDMEKYLVDLANATTDICILRGTEILEVPDEIMTHKDDECGLEMRTLGFEDADNIRSRYLYWVKYVAAPLDRDMNLLLGALGRKTGISEADVLEAVTRFQRTQRQ